MAYHVPSSCLIPTFLIISILLHESNSEEICKYASPGEALPICTSTTKTGNTIFIDTSKVPPNEAIKCNCSVDINASAQSVHVGYELSVATWPDATSCGLRFQTGTIGFKCNDNPLVELTKSFNQLQFSKDTSDVDACFILFIDRDITNKSYATVTCYRKEVTSITSESTSARTSTLRSTDKSTHTNSATSPSRVSVTPTISSNGFTSSTENNSGASDGQTKDEDEESNSTTVIIAAAAGGGGAFAIFIGVILLYYYCRKRKPKKHTLPKHGYVNTDVTDNVVYNMEFPDEGKQRDIPLNDLDVKYNHVEDGTYNTVDYATDEKKTHILSSFKYESKDNDAGTYTTVDIDKDIEIPKSNNLNDRATDMAIDPSYETLENTVDRTADDNNPNETQHQDSDMTYSVVDKSKPKDIPINYQRPKQFEVSGSGETYAVVDKTSCK